MNTAAAAASTAETTYYGYVELVRYHVPGALQPEPAAWVALSLMSAGLLVKSALFPLHFWLPPAHASAPAPVSALLHAVAAQKLTHGQHPLRGRRAAGQDHGVD